jgi:serine/threonine protein phosphatase PrpC
MHSYRRSYNQETKYVKKLQERIKNFDKEEVEDRLNDSFEWEIHEKIEFDKFMNHYNEMKTMQADKKEKLMIEKKSLSRRYSKSPSGGSILRNSSKEKKPVTLKA